MNAEQSTKPLLDNGNRDTKHSARDTCHLDVPHAPYSKDFVLFAWGSIFLAFAIYIIGLQGQVLEQTLWDRFQTITQIIVTVWLFLAILVVIGEIYQAGKKASSPDWQPSPAPTTSRLFSKSMTFLSKWTIVIVVGLWVVLPGTNSLLQVIEHGTSGQYSNVTIEYTYLSEVDMASRYALCCNGLFAEYTRLLLSQGDFLHSAADFYGNVKVPDFASLKEYSEDDEEWTPILLRNDTVYSSLLGIPVSGIPATGTTKFTLENSYYSVKCDNVSLAPPQAFWVIGAGDAISESPLFDGPFSRTNTTFGLDSTASLSIATSGFQRLRWPGRWEEIRGNTSTTTSFEPQPLLVQSTFYGSSIHYVREHLDTYLRNNTVSAYCKLQTHYVSVNISCTHSSCKATSMRPSRMLHPNMNLTDFGNIRAFYEFSRDFMIAGRDGHAGVDGAIYDGNTLTEYFLQDPYFGGKRDLWGSYGPYYQHIMSTPEEFGTRVQMILNGFKMLQMGGTTVRDWPNLSNTRLTNGENVIEESLVVVKMWKVLAVSFLGLFFVAWGIAKTVRRWLAASRPVQLP